MSRDLKLLPLLQRNFWVSHQILQLERRRELWPEIEAIPQRTIPDKLSCYLAIGKDDEPCYGEIDTDPYGEVLKFTTAADLLKLESLLTVQDNWENRAIWAYLSKMPRDWPIVLYWH